MSAEPGGAAPVCQHRVMGGQDMEEPGSIRDQDKGGRFGSAVVLCGGKSSRAGFDKQLLTMDGMPIALAIANRLNAVFSDIILVTNRPDLYSDPRFTVTEDIIRNVGPLGGLHAGLMSARNDMVFLTACDMPNVCIPYIEWMKRRILEKEPNCNVAVVKRMNGHTEPFNGFYSRDAIPVIERAAGRKEYKLTGIYDMLRIFYVSETDMENFGCTEKLFRNMNWPDEIKPFISE